MYIDGYWYLNGSFLLFDDLVVSREMMRDLLEEKGGAGFTST